MSYESVLYKKNNAIGIISLNRPDMLNAQDRKLILETRAALEEAESDPDIKVVILKGEGRAFCTGDDLAEDFSDVTTTEGAMRVIENLQQVTRVIMRMPKPVIASVHGYALGAGCEWSMNCDIRIAAEGTKFGFPEAKWGYTVTNAGTKFLPLLVGLARAKEMVFTTEYIDAAQAYDWGMVNHVVPLEELETKTMEVVEKILKSSPLSVALAKRALNNGVFLGFEETLKQETQDAVTVAFSPETLERLKQAAEDSNSIKK